MIASGLEIGREFVTYAFLHFAIHWQCRLNKDRGRRLLEWLDY